MQRPEILYPLFADPTTLEGIGATRARQLGRLGIATVGDLLFLPPNGVIDRRLRDDLSSIEPGEVATARIRVLEHRKGRVDHQPYRVVVEGAKRSFELVYFHANSARIEQLEQQLPVGETRVVSGKAELFNGYLQIPHPDFVMTEEDARDAAPFEPVYPLTQGITRTVMRKAIEGALGIIPDLPEWQSPETLREFGWPGWADALRALHAPGQGDMDGAGSPARARLAFDELLSNQLALGLARARMRGQAGRMTRQTAEPAVKAANAFGFAPTSAQLRALEEIREDMAAPVRMLRLLQGDVGSGKTWVAMQAMLAALEAGGQAAFMAPTELLAHQHAAHLGRIAIGAGANLILLTGADTGGARRDKLARIGNGLAQIVVGTHALFQKEIAFKDLRLAVIDEQHRFGVRQRMALAAKAPAGADILVMSATPIPRTLALAKFGDLDMSVLDAMPPGRRPVETRLVSRERYEEVVGRLAQALDRGSRAYWVCPLVRESQATDLIAVEKRHRGLAMRLGTGRVGLVHGQMSSEEKIAGMRAFQGGETRLLVASTVIGFGVDVTDATIMVIEQAENFGLSQLHQLRGRVGRGTEPSSCLLLFDPPLDDGARERLEAVRGIDDGFRIAEEDLRLRGPGDLIGTAQSGAQKFRIADLGRDHMLMVRARAETGRILRDDPSLVSSRGKALRMLLHLMGEDVVEGLTSGI